MSDTPVNPFDDAEEIAKKSMVLFFLIDCSGSMGGSKIGTVNSVMEELIPEMSQGKHSNIGTIFFAVGFSVMMTLDVALG